MPTNRNQGGGMFARYSGEQFSPVPAGYLESAAQEANMYANIGSTIANLMGRKQEMDMKKDQMEIDREANRIKGLSEENKNLDIYLKDERERLKYGQEVESNKLKTLFDADKMYGDRIYEAQDQLSPDNPNQVTDPKERALIEQKIRGWSTSRNSLLDTVDRLMKFSPSAQTNGTPATEGPIRSILKKQMDAYQNTPPGVRSPKPPIFRLNPNEAPAATTGADGGLSGDAYRAAGIPVATKAIFGNRIIAAAPVQAEPEQRTVDGKPSTVNPDKPDLAKGDLGYSYVISSNIVNSKKSPVVGQIRVTSNKNGTNQYALEFNEAQITPASIGDVNVLRSNQQVYRNLHAIQFILESGLNSGIDPNEDEIRVANEVYNADKSGAPFSVQQAVALLLRDQTPGVKGDAHTLAFNDAFRRRFDTSPDMYLVAGEEKPESIVVRPSQIPRLEIAQQEVQDRILKASKEEKKRPEDVGIDSLDPTQGARATLLTQIEAIENRMRGVPVDSSIGKTLAKRRDNLQKRYEIYKSESEVWAKNLERFRAEQEAGKEDFKQAEELREQIASKIGVERWNAELEAKAKARLDGLVMDKSRFNGWKAHAVVNWPGDITVPLPNGTLVKAGPQDLIDTARRTGDWGIILRTTTGMRIPDPEKDIPALNTANTEHNKLIPPLNRLMAEFKQLDSDDAMEAFGKKWFDPNTASREPDVFAVLASLRKPYTGGGNPSNFEQQMLLSAIPNPGTIFTFNSFSIHRLRSIALLSMLDHARNMQQHGLVLDQDAIDSYNRDYAGILGRPITIKDFNKYMSLVDTYSSGWRGGSNDWQNQNSQNSRTGQAAFEAMLTNVQSDFPAQK